MGLFPIGHVTFLRLLTAFCNSALRSTPNTKNTLPPVKKHTETPAKHNKHNLFYRFPWLALGASGYIPSASLSATTEPKIGEGL